MLSTLPKKGEEDAKTKLCSFSDCAKQVQFNGMCSLHYQEKGGGRCENKTKNGVLFLIAQNKKNQNALECASDIAKSSSCYFRSAEKLHLPKL